ncbi:MAG: succinate dehydrogenase assembly factor 2 [Alcanivoracaceae bacterium]|jgi:antitoxin CptB|nr:succinate dehydrogenase assembly factor 2 [Alcanivoracaceae bacterium]
MEAAEHKRRLAWQCRRGLKEVDLVVNGWLDGHFDNASADDQALFASLLEEQDADLFEWFTERSRPGDETVATFIDRMLRDLGKPV